MIQQSQYQLQTGLQQTITFIIDEVTNRFVNVPNKMPRIW